MSAGECGSGYCTAVWGTLKTSEPTFLPQIETTVNISDVKIHLTEKTFQVTKYGKIVIDYSETNDDHYYPAGYLKIREKDVEIPKLIIKGDYLGCNHDEEKGFFSFFFESDVYHVVEIDEDIASVESCQKVGVLPKIVYPEVVKNVIVYVDDTFCVEQDCKRLFDTKNERLKFQGIARPSKEVSYCLKLSNDLPCSTGLSLTQGVRGFDKPIKYILTGDPNLTKSTVATKISSNIYETDAMETVYSFLEEELDKYEVIVVGGKYFKGEKDRNIFISFVKGKYQDVQFITLKFEL